MANKAIRRSILLLVFVIVVSLLSSCNDRNDGSNSDTDDDVADDDSTGDDDTSYCDDPYFKNKAWTDPETGLIWQVVHSCERYRGQNQYCDDIDIGGMAGWRIPTISELRTLIRGCPATETGGECGVTDECFEIEHCNSASCNGCGGEGPTNGCFSPPELLGECLEFWSSTSSSSTSESNFWFVNFYGAIVATEWGSKDDTVYLLVRCVHDPL